MKNTILTLGSALLLTLGTYACSSSGQSSVNNGTPASATVAQNSTGDVNTAGLNNSTGAYSGGNAMPSGPANVSAETMGEQNQATSGNRVGGKELVQAAPSDTSYAGTGQTLITSSGSKTASSNVPVTTTTTSTTTYSTPTVVQTAPVTVAPNTDTTATITTTTPVTTAEVTTPTVTENTTTETPMTSSTQESTSTTTTTTTHTHRRMHKD